jgi:hypothetical protein
MDGFEPLGERLSHLFVNL